MASNVSLTGIARDLADREEQGNPIRVGLVGCGEMGTDVVTRIAHMQGIEIVAIANLDPAAALKAAAIAYGRDDRARVVGSGNTIAGTVETGAIAVSDDSFQVISHPMIDVVIDATGVPSVGAETGLAAMENGKHLVMMNVEADVTIGAYLKSEADRLGVVYSLGAGDEPSSCMELIEFVSAMGHPIVCAGKGKNNPLDFDAIPDDYRQEAEARNMNVRMLVEFVDGSKTMVEMTAIANATGLVPDKPGMHGPAATLGELSSKLVPEADGGVLSRPGCVDFSVGKGVAPGVFVIADMSHPRITERMEDLKMGKGPYFTFHRPFHLTSLEVPLTCARAVLYGRADMVPLSIPVAEVCAVAKKDLQPGEILDAIGEYTYRAWNMKREEALAQSAIPCGILEGGKAIKPISKGELITYHNAEVKPGSKLAEIRKKQDDMVEQLVANSG